MYYDVCMVCTILLVDMCTVYTILYDLACMVYIILYIMVYSILPPRIAKKMFSNVNFCTCATYVICCTAPPPPTHIIIPALKPIVHKRNMKLLYMW